MTSFQCAVRMRGAAGRGFAAIALGLLTLWAPLASVAAGATPFFDNRALDLRELLPPPPVATSAVTRAEIDELLALQSARTPEMEARAITDSKLKVWVFADVIADPGFTKTNLPVCAAFFSRVIETAGAVVDPVKEEWNRPRPYALCDRLQPVVERPASGSYPSGHTTIGTTVGIVLANMVPEQRAAIMARAWELGRSRLVGGVHFPSDIETGRIAGTAIAHVLSTRADFKVEFTAARAELRGLLGLGDVPGKP